MGDFIREAFRTSGINEKMQDVIAETIMQRWNDEAGRRNHRSASSVAPQNVDSIKYQSDTGKMQLISEQLWRRLERKYEERLQKYKDKEEKVIEEKIISLKAEYKRNLDFAYSQCEEKLRRKDEELRRKEEILKEENQLESEKRYLEIQRAWSEIEASKKDLRIQKEHFDVAKSNFALKMSNDNLVLQRQKDELVKKENHLKERERGLKEEIKTAVTEAKKKERDWIVEKVKEWNMKEAKLIEKCENLQEKMRQFSKLQSTISEQSSHIRVLQGDLITLRGRLNDSEEKLRQANSKLHEYNDYEILREENKRMKEELLSKSKDDVLAIKESELNNLRRRLKLVEETADLRIKELKFRLKTDQLRQTLGERHQCHIASTSKCPEKMLPVVSDSVKASAEVSSAGSEDGREPLLEANMFQLL
ncbi:unnamed protein product [Enterobius vermicularis]|uniref:FRIGIDA-like protein n=1 Tax=Enterobius vermicularis TaxID=51028 RepID=A0A158Q9H7_ENTVE|nr:unnamed protein product [Enterobius vermicularis]